MAEALRYVLFYDSGDLSLAAEHFPAHQARYTDFMRRGDLLALGPFSDRAGSMAVFATREGAEEFAKGDPFVLHGVVSSWEVRAWRVVTPG
ncbi:MAG TPA: YciI family protein [Trebonia sp.]|nr:YciI family protein [Trebonia sp.]